VLVEIFNLFGVELTSLSQNFLKIALLLVAHHSNVRCRSSYALRLAIPNYLVACPIHGFSLLRLNLCWLLVLLTTKNIGSLTGESTQVLGNVISTCKCCIRLPLCQLLLLFFPLRVHNTNLEVLSPVTLRDVLFAIWALLSTFSF